MSSHHTMKPTGGANMRHVMDPSYPNVKLLERILSRDREPKSAGRTRPSANLSGGSKSCEFTPLNFPKGTLFNRGEHSFPGYGPVDSVKRPVRTRMRDAVGAGGERPPATLFATRVKTLRHQRDKPLIIIMCTNPKPVQDIIFHESESTIVRVDSYGPNSAGLFETQGGMAWVLLP